jgi:pimeloyl-ACP methyl ester carboxylesterase
MEQPVIGQEHWTHKDGVRLFLWEKTTGEPARRGTILFVHGSSMASQPTYDLTVPGLPDASAMDWFARRGFATWCLDCEGYGRSDKHRDINCDIANGAADVAAAARYITETRGCGPLLVYGSSSGALRSALFASQNPHLVRRLALDAFVWTGKGSPTLEQRRKRLPEYQRSNRRPLDRSFVEGIFLRDHAGSADQAVVDAFADAVLALDDSVPTGTYVDMCSRLPLVDPATLTMPTLVMRGQFDGIASDEDILDFFGRLPNPDKHLAVMPGIAHGSFRQKNYALAYHILLSFLSQPEPVYRSA